MNKYTKLLSDNINREFKKFDSAEHFKAFDTERKLYMQAKKWLREHDNNKPEANESMSNSAPENLQDMVSKILGIGYKTRELLKYSESIVLLSEWIDKELYTKHSGMIKDNETEEAYAKKAELSEFRKLRVITFMYSWLKQLHECGLLKFMVIDDHAVLVINLVSRDLSFRHSKIFISDCVEYCKIIYADKLAEESHLSSRIWSSIKSLIY